MPSAEKISALRGMRDVFSAEYGRQRQVRILLERRLRLHGYQSIDSPILENTELYLRKLGEDIAARLYEFDYRSRRIALRPEVTASILRAYVEHLQDEPLPLRLQYSGPVFRYEKPQQNRYRQFTLSGAELLGAKGPRADAEIINLACSGLEHVGIRDYKLVIGQTDVLEGFLQGLGLRKQLVNFLLRNMENLRKRGIDAVVESLREIYPEYESAAATAVGSEAAGGEQSQQLINVLREMTDGEAHQAITDFLHSLNIRIDSNREEGEVIERLLHKIREDQQGPKLQVALDFMRRLGELVGEPTATLRQARALAADFRLDGGALDALGRTLECLAEYGGISGDIELDLGLNRGLHYYTGLIFELQCPTGGGEAIQICGGGRYDNLVSILGGAATPALGFAYGIERIAGVLDAKSRQPTEARAIYVVPVAEADYAAAFSIAKDLRAREIATEVSIEARGLGRSLKRADRRGARLVIIIGEAERAAQSAILRDMRSRREQRVALAELAGVVEECLSADG